MFLFLVDLVLSMMVVMYMFVGQKVPGQTIKEILFILGERTEIRFLHRKILSEKVCCYFLKFEKCNEITC